jgi:hypothetical protein
MKVTTPNQLFVAAMMLAGILAGGIGTAAAQAPTLNAIPGLFNTGVDNNGDPVPGGTPDPHYMLMSTPTGATRTKAVVGKTLNSYWTGKLEDTPKSRWIGLGENLGKNEPAGDYTYQTTFDLKGDPNTASITGQVAADDIVAIRFNGEPVAIRLNGEKMPLTLGRDYGKLFPFKICDGFKQGSNTLEFFVHNHPLTPTGLHVQLSGTVSPAR